MPTNDGSPVPYTPHAKPVKISLPSTQEKIPEKDSIVFLLRTIFRMSHWDWVLIAALIACLFAHYIFTIFAFEPPIIDITRLIATLLSATFIAFKIKYAYVSKDLIIDFFKNHPIQLFVSIIACGATLSFFLPLILNLFKFIGDTDKLTASLLASTGGVIAVFTLIKTHQKNLHDELSLKLDRAKYEDQIINTKIQIYQMEEQKRQFHENLKQESNKNKQERIRQIHAERRSRYTKAIEQLADNKAAVRLGGIYTLVGLIDEWIADESIKEKDSRRKEGQVIINNLCSYIRSPFNLAEDREIIEKTATSQGYSGNLNEDKAKLREEQEVRQTIFNEISNHLAELTKNSSTDNYWKYFNYDFSKSKIFYSLDGLTFSNPNFSNTEFNGPANFTGSRFLGKTLFKNATFNSATYMSDSESAKTIFEGEADFTGSIFKGNVTFKNATFNSLAHFSDFNSAKTIFEAEVDFTGSTFSGDAIFRNTTFTLAATFSSEYSSRTNFEAGSDFSLSTFSHNSNFSNVNFHQDSNFEITSFGGMAKFVKTNFYGSAQFSIYGGPQYSENYSFSGDANFTDAYFKEGASFTERYFEKSVIFRNAIFEGPAYFSEGKITDSGIFKNTIFKDSTRFAFYTFGIFTDFKDAKFSTRKAHEFQGTHNIVLGSVPIDIRWPQTQIPLGSRYGLLSSWDSKTKSFTDTSDPAM